MRNLKLTIIFVVLFVVCLNTLSFASILDIHPNIITVSSGLSSAYSRFRLIVTKSEIYLHLYIQKIEIGEEGCCTKVVKTYDIDGDKLGGNYSIYSVTDIKWLSHDSLKLKVGIIKPKIYIIRNLDGKYEIIESDKLNS